MIKILKKIATNYYYMYTPILLKSYSFLTNNYDFILV
jgi:hypothetical protein